jgi:hypothetical protein
MIMARSPMCVLVEEHSQWKIVHEMRAAML